MWNSAGPAGFEIPQENGCIAVRTFTGASVNARLGKAGSITASGMALLLKTSCFILSLFIFLLLIPSGSMSEPRQAIRIGVTGSMIEVEAREVALDELLQAMSEKAGMHLKLKGQMAETVSVSLEPMPVEEALKRVLQNRGSFMLNYKRTADGRLVPGDLQVMPKSSAGSAGTLKPEAPAVAPPAAPVPGPPGYSLEEQNDAAPNDRVQKVVKEDFVKQFDDEALLMTQMSATPLTDGPLSQGGIKVTDVDEGSALAGLGIAPGDVIEKVNANPVASTQEFIDLLKSPPDGLSLLTIQRQTNGIYAPIYIYFR